VLYYIFKLYERVIFLEFLKFLESIRTPFLDNFFSLITKFGEETIFIILGIFIFWCVNKKQGYYVLFVGFAGVVINQFLKLAFRIPRPWVKDPSFTIVESARAEATGYSFPSGHTQISVGAYGSIAKSITKKIIRIICIILCLLVPFSRMYLGVHTPLDVSVSIILALLLIFGLYPIINKNIDNKRNMRILLGFMILLSFIYVLYTELFPFPANIDMSNYQEGLSNAYKILGCILGVWIGFELDNKYIKFDTKAVWWAQVLKLILGLVPVLIIKSVLKTPLISLIDNANIANGIRYFLIVLFACGVWPITFKYFNKLGKNNII